MSNMRPMVQRMQNLQRRIERLETQEPIQQTGGLGLSDVNVRRATAVHFPLASTTSSSVTPIRWIKTENIVDQSATAGTAWWVYYSFGSENIDLSDNSFLIIPVYRVTSQFSTSADVNMATWDTEIILDVGKISESWTPGSSDTPAVGSVQTYVIGYTKVDNTDLSAITYRDNTVFQANWGAGPANGVGTFAVVGPTMTSALDNTGAYGLAARIRINASWSTAANIDLDSEVVYWRSDLMTIIDDKNADSAGYTSGIEDSFFKW